MIWLSWDKNCQPVLLAYQEMAESDQMVGDALSGGGGLCHYRNWGWWYYLAGLVYQFLSYWESLKVMLQLIRVRACSRPCERVERMWNCLMAGSLLGRRVTGWCWWCLSAQASSSSSYFCSEFYKMKNPVIVQYIIKIRQRFLPNVNLYLLIAFVISYCGFLLNNYENNIGIQTLLYLSS